MSDVELHGEYESVIFFAVKELNRYMLLAADLGRAKPVYAIDNAHRLVMHEDGRELIIHFRKHFEMIRVLAGTSWRVGDLQCGDGYGDNWKLSFITWFDFQPLLGLEFNEFRSLGVSQLSHCKGHPVSTVWLFPLTKIFAATTRTPRACELLSSSSQTGNNSVA